MSSFFRFLSPSKVEEQVLPARSRDLSPAQRFSHFKATWRAIQKHSTIVDKKQRSTQLHPHIIALTDYLLDEETRADRASPKACLEFAIQRDVFSWLLTLALSGPQELTVAIARSFTSLVEVQDDGFLTHEVVCKNVNLLLDHLAKRTHKVALLERMVDLLFAICSRIHHYPPLLAMFFDTASWHDRAGASSDIRHEEEFLIFYQLMDNMHQPDRLGDFCRTGLLYILNASKDNEDVQKWIGESELPTFLAVGIGSNYSALGLKIVPNGTALNGLFLPRTHLDDPNQAGDVSTATFDRFMMYLCYWQDMLATISSVQLKSIFLTSLRALFLECILYPALLQTSSEDTASVVAVTTYLTIILEVIHIPDLIDMTLNYLFASEVTDLSASTAAFQPEIFSLKDFILDNLESESPEIKVATLRLLGTIMRKHWHYVCPKLMRTVPITQPITIGHHIKEMQILQSLISPVVSIESSQSYENYLHDARASLEAQNDRIDELFMLTGRSAAVLISGRTAPLKTKHTLAANDALLGHILRLLATFLANTIELNLALTKVIADLASCRYRCLDGWLLFASADSWIAAPGSIAPDHTMQNQSVVEQDRELIADLERAYDSEGDASSDDGNDASYYAERARALPSWSNFPPFLTTFKQLSAQIGQYKSEIDSLEQDIQDRRVALERVGTPEVRPAMRNRFSNPSIISQSRKMFSGDGSISESSRNHSATSLPSAFGLANSETSSNPKESAHVSVDLLINNIILYEEFIKELMSIVQVRRSLYDSCICI